MPHTSPPAGNRTRAKSMRRKMTDAELKLWNELRAHQLMGLGFRRQFPVGRYIADFACPEKKIIVEVDGSQHADEKQSAVDAVRSAELEKDGWTVLRFWNDEILRDIDDVCHHIVIAAGLTAVDAARRAPAGALEKRA
ncbi:MAG: endonuclease domain-containing protein [Rhizobiaceae bacterium]|nr:endonuclease domain-containing protein [Rhizobiaceae bacterium]